MFNHTARQLLFAKQQFLINFFYYRDSSSHNLLNNLHNENHNWFIKVKYILNKTRRTVIHPHIIFHSIQNKCVRSKLRRTTCRTITYCPIIIELFNLSWIKSIIIDPANIKLTIDVIKPKTWNIQLSNQNIFALYWGVESLLLHLKS